MKRSGRSVTEARRVIEMEDVLEASSAEGLSEAHSVAMRLRLYIEDERTVGVLLKHVQDKIVDDWMNFRDLVCNMYNGALRSKAPTEGSIREKVVRGSAEDWDPDPVLHSGTVVYPHRDDGANVANGSSGVAGSSSSRGS